MLHYPHHAYIIEENHIRRVQICGLSFLCVCIGHNCETVMCAKTAQLMEMQFGVWTRVGPRNPYQLGPRSPQGKQQLLRVPPVMQPF